jgi:hypothetical protein
LEAQLEGLKIGVTKKKSMSKRLDNLKEKNGP